jgi:SAM-dependent methyltransferase
MDLRDTFDTVADVYDAARPGYPAGLFADIAETTGLEPGDAVLEVGCGSGQATEGLLGLGAYVTALDPGPALIAAAKARFAGRGGVRFVTARFEAWTPPARAFRLVAAAQAWHWVPPAEGFARAAAALQPGGWLAIFGHAPVGFPKSFTDAAQPLYMRFAPELWAPPPESWYLPPGPVSGLIATSGAFAPPVHRAHPWTWRHTPDSFRAFLTSRSDVQVLPTGRREPLIDGLARIVADQGGLAIGYESHLYMSPLK